MTKADQYRALLEEAIEGTAHIAVSPTSWIGKVREALYNPDVPQDAHPCQLAPEARQEELFA
jgi:hypothetical protein